jgi:aryl-alcohol dehydrogenase-like predicted oxidoreductase
MRSRVLGPLGPVSALALGGGGIGSVWGPTSRAEAVATARAAVVAGITLLDMAPLYGAAEDVVGEAFGGNLPDGVQVITKCRLGNPPANEVYDRLSESLNRSLERMHLSHVDAYLLHGALSPEAEDTTETPGLGVPAATSIARYRDAVIPAFERLIAEGRIRFWGIPAIKLPLSVLDEGPMPAIAECVSNFMDTPGGTISYDPNIPMRDLIAAVARAGIGVLGVRAVQAGALVDHPDRELNPTEAGDFERAAAFRALARELGTTAAILAHRYALSMQNVSTVVLGVKNRDELYECLAAAEAGPLPAEIIAQVDATVPRTP